MMMWIFLATGFTGAWTLLFLMRSIYRRFAILPSITAYHSPKGGCTDAIVYEIRQARREILVQAYSFTSKPITEALIEAKTRGIAVEIILDHSNEKEERTSLHEFVEHGLTPLIDAHHAIAHNKVMVVDKRTLITGSFNFTHQAEAENAENVLIIKGHPELVTLYRQNFASHKSHCRAPNKDAHAAPSHRAA